MPATPDGTDVKELSLENKSVRTLLSTHESISGAVVSARGELYCAVETMTPTRKPTTQVFLALSDGRLQAVSAPEESYCFGLASIMGVPTYIKSTRWAGAFAGVPWQDPTYLCQVQSIGKTPSTSIGKVTQLWAPSSWTEQYPLLEFVSFGRSSVKLIDTRNGHAVEFGEYPSPDSPTLSRDGKQLALLQWRQGQRYQDVIVVEVPTGRVLLTIPLSSRGAQVAYDNHGQLFCVEYEVREPTADLLRLDGEKFVKIATLN